MVYKNLCIFVLWTKVALLALVGLRWSKPQAWSVKPDESKRSLYQNVWHVNWPAGVIILWDGVWINSDFHSCPRFLGIRCLVPRGIECCGEPVNRCDMRQATGHHLTPGPSFLCFGWASGSTWALFKTINVDQRWSNVSRSDRHRK